MIPHATYILDKMENEISKLEDHNVLQGFSDMFPDEFLGLPPKRDIDFTIDFIP